MHVILEVAADTIRGCTSENVIDVALRTLDLRVLAGELVDRQVVVKDLGLPAFGVMAAGTIWAKGGRVGVIRLMAAGAVGWGVFETCQVSHIHMAVDTAGIGMLAQQRIGQLVVIKPVLRKDIGAFVAGPAVRAVLAHVDRYKPLLIVTMAGFTAGRLEARQAFCMAIYAGEWQAIGCRLMGSQAEAKQVVVDLALFYLNQIPLWTAMLGVACPTVGCFQHAVQTGRVTLFCLDLGVAVNAQVIHALAAPGSGVAGSAVVPQFSMRSYLTENQPALVDRRERARAEDVAAAGQAYDHNQEQRGASKL